MGGDDALQSVVGGIKASLRHLMVKMFKEAVVDIMATQSTSNPKAGMIAQIDYMAAQRYLTIK
jgi:hypothetical protein